MMLSKSKLAQYSLCLSIGAALAFLPELAIAGTTDVAAVNDKGLGKLASTATSGISAVGSLLVAVSYVAGIGLVLAGMMGFKAHKENPQQYPLSKAIVLVAVGAGLVYLPSVINLGGETLGMSTKASAGGKMD